MIRIEGLRKTFGPIRAVDGLSLEAGDGRITTILGANGSGKTTTLRMIAGLIAPQDGNVSVDGFDVVRRRAKALSRLGVLHDEFGLYPRLTVEEHIRFSARLFGLWGNAHVERAIEALSLQDIAKRLAANLSHGQRMKTALARAIVHRPRNLLLDEPTRGLDIFAVRLLRDLLKRLRAEGICVLMSSHAMPEVEELSDHIVVIANGRVLAQGTSQDIVSAAKAQTLEDAFVELAARANMDTAA